MTQDKGPGRRRSRTSHLAILKAAMTILKEKGYKAVSVEAIARAAGVGKQTIYRWWPSKSAVVLEAFAAYAARQIPVPDRGDLRSDLETFLGRVFSELRQQPGAMVRALMSEALLDPDFADAFRRFFIAKRRTTLGQIIKRASLRNEISPNLDLELVIDLIYGPMWYRLLNQHAPLDDAFCQSLTDLILKAVEPRNI